MGGKGTVESGERFKKLFKLMFSVQEILSEKQVCTLCTETLVHELATCNCLTSILEFIMYIIIIFNVSNTIK